MSSKLQIYTHMLSINFAKKPRAAAKASTQRLKEVMGASDTTWIIETFE